jgi:hypothetical protein
MNRPPLHRHHRTTRRGLGCVASFLALAVPADAGTFTPPAGCTGYLTVQMRGCVVSNLYRCEKDAPGDQWRADFNDAGPFFVSRIDSETQWVESYDLSPPEHEMLEPGAKDPASFSELLATGQDSFNFSTVTDDGVRRMMTGHDRLTGETVVIDGVSLKRTEYEITARAEDGSVLWQSQGHEYISPEWRVFFSGVGMWDGGDGAVPTDNTPMHFVLPGQPGFFTNQPVFDCDTTMSALPTPKERVIR